MLLAMDEPTKQSATAFHEAGHAVTALALGRPVQQVSIIAKQNRLGQIKMKKGRFRPTKDWLEDEILILLAGPVAEALHTGTYDWAGAAQDLRDARRLSISRAGSERKAEKLEQRLLSKTEHLLSDDGHWAAVEMVAAELLRVEKISGRAATHWFNQAMQQQDR